MNALLGILDPNMSASSQPPMFGSSNTAVARASGTAASPEQAASLFAPSEEMEDEDADIEQRLQDALAQLEAALAAGDLGTAGTLESLIASLQALLGGGGSPLDGLLSSAPAGDLTSGGSPGGVPSTASGGAGAGYGGSRPTGGVVSGGGSNESVSSAADDSDIPPPPAAGPAPNVAPSNARGGSIKGLDPLASDALRRAGLSSDDVSQGEGNAQASAGYHLAEPGSDYTAAADIRTSSMSGKQIRKVLDNLGEQGFAAWYRHGSDWSGNEHIHAVYAGIPMKGELEGQVRSFLAGHSGLSSDAVERDAFAPSPRAKQVVHALFTHRENRVSVQPSTPAGAAASEKQTPPVSPTRSSKNVSHGPGGAA